MFYLKKHISSPNAQPKDRVVVMRNHELIHPLHRRYGLNYTWHRVTMARPHQISHIKGVDTNEVLKWQNSQASVKLKNPRSPDLYSICVRPTVGAPESCGNQASDEESQLNYPITKVCKQLVESLDSDVFALDDMPSVDTRIYSFTSSTNLDLPISPNELWHIDHIQYKTVSNLSLFFEKEGGSNFVSTVTGLDGPTTFVLDVDEIELPILNITGHERFELINAYVDALLGKGLVTMHALAPNTWTMLPTTSIHRGPRGNDVKGTSADRSFFHVSGEFVPKRSK